MDILQILEEAQYGAAKLLADKVKDGTATAADINALRAMFKDAGGSYTFRDKPTETGQRVLECLDDIDPKLLKSHYHN